MVTSDLGRVTTYLLTLKLRINHCGDVRSRTSYNEHLYSYGISFFIVVTSDLGRVTTYNLLLLQSLNHCGDVRSRTSYNLDVCDSSLSILDIVVTSDLGRVTTFIASADVNPRNIVVTSDLGRVTTYLLKLLKN